MVLSTKALIKNCLSGEYQLPLNSVDLAGPIEEWKDLAAVDDGSNQYLGDLCLSLRYVPSSGKLTGQSATYIIKPLVPKAKLYCFLPELREPIVK